MSKRGLECQNNYFRLTLSKKNSSPLVLWSMSKEQKSSLCQRNLTTCFWEENQPARATLRNIICQGQFAFARRQWCIAFHIWLRCWARWEMNSDQKGCMLFFQDYAQTPKQQLCISVIRYLCDRIWPTAAFIHMLYARCNIVCGCNKLAQYYLKM